MKRFFSTAHRRARPLAWAGFMAVISIAPACAMSAEPSPAPPEAKAAASAPGKSAATDSPSNQWRFVWHGSQWWYYQPNGQWLVHDGSAWHAPQAATAQTYRPSRANSYQSQPRYRQFMTNQRTNGGMDNDGFWGNSPRYWTYQHVFKSQ